MTNNKMASYTSEGALWLLSSTNFIFRYLAHQAEQQEGTQTFSFVSAASASSVWAVDAGGSVYKLIYTPFTQPPFGKPWHISAGSDGQVWAIDGDGHTKVWSNGDWIEKDNGGLTIMQISLSNASNVWGIDGGGWWGGPGTAAQFNGTKWVAVTSPVLRWISVGPDDSVWALDDATKRQLFKYQGGQWTPMGSPAPAVLWQIAALGNNEVYGWFGTKLFSFAGGRWSAVPGMSSVNSAGCSVDGTVVVGTNHELKRLVGFGVWETIPYQGQAFSVLPVNAHLLYIDDLYNNAQWLGNTWQQMPGSNFANVTVAVDGTVWGADQSFNVFAFDGSAWQSRPGAMKKVSTGASNQIIGLSSDGTKLAKWDGSAWQPIALPAAEATLLDASIGADGTIYIVGASNIAYFLLASGAWKRSAAPKLIQVHVADHDHASGITINDSHGNNNIWLGGALDRILADPVLGPLYFRET